MATGQSKIELILELKNKIGAGLSQAKMQIRSDIGGMKSNLSQFASSARRDLRGVADELPGVKSGFAMLSNPITLAAAGVGALTVGLMKATDRAAEFNHEFRDLANLNLGKSQAELDELRNMVLDSAWKKGFNAEKTSNAYNELQSTAGIYGANARPIVEKQGEFALLMKTSMDDYVAGTAKAMANWRFGVDKLDAYNKSNYAAMQVGVVSFAELAKVQSTFAGSAASINQSFDTANKIFSVFTVKTKSVDEAATLTKSLFNDLTKAPTIKAFKSIGIDVFDSNKQLKQADIIMLELNKKFLQMKNDKAIVGLKNQFRGSEGLIAMIQAATDKTGELKNLMDEFSDSKFNADMALSQAHNDIIYRQEQLTNKVDNLMIRLGNWALPIKEAVVGVAEKMTSSLDYWYLKSPEERAKKRESGTYDMVKNQNSALFADIDKITEAQLTERQDSLIKLSKDAYNRYQKTTQTYLTQPWYQYDPILALQGRDGKLESMDKNNGYERHDDWAKYKAYKDLSSDLGAKWHDKTSTATTPSDDKSNDLSGNLGDTLNRVVGAAQAPRNLYVNIDAFNKGGINTQNTELQKMDGRQIEDWFTDVCMRAVRNVEMNY